MPRTRVQRFYRRQARFYDLTRWLVLRGRRQAVAALGLHPQARVLEVGCGTGLSFRHILAHLDPAAGRLTGLDFSPEMLRQAALRVRRRGWTSVELVGTDAARFDLGRRFDAVLLAFSLSMIPDWLAALARVQAHLAPGGRVVVHDFGRFAAWGPLAAPLRGWLRHHGVEVLRPYADGLRRHFNDVTVRTWLGGYTFTAVGRAGVQS